MIHNFTSFLNEGRYDKSILDVTREFINVFKAKFGKKFKFNTEYEHGEYEGDDDVVKIRFDVRPLKKSNGDFSIHADSELEQIDIVIQYNPEYFPFSYNRMIADIKNTLRHEMTHIKQYVDEERMEMDDEEEEMNKPLPSETYTSEGDAYFFQPSEIEAFVNGFYKESKTKRQTFTKTINDWIEDNYKIFINKENALKVRKLWLNDFKKRYGSKYL